MRSLCSVAASWKALHVLFELKQLSECRSRAADKLVVLVEHKKRPADTLDGLAECESRVADKSGFADGSRAAGKVFWELSVAAIGCSAKDSGSYLLLWHSPQELADWSRAAGKVFWELLVAAIGCSAKDYSSYFFTVA